MGTPAIVVRGVSKHFRQPHEQMHTAKERALHPLRRRTYDQFDAVKDVSFAVERGEFFGIVGRNGSGKSTLLKMIAGIYKTNGGEIWVDGRMSTFIELGVGFNPDLAARDNVVLNAIMLGLTPSEARARYEQVIEFAELREFANLKLKNYSSGMHVRLAFSVMIQVDADILLVDEVLAVGDAAFQQKCFDVFNRLRDEGKTIVLVTHDMGAVRRFAHRAMLMERGKIDLVGDSERVGSRYLELNFQHEQAAAPPSEEPDRPGDGRARITDIWMEDDQGEPVTVVPSGADVTVKAVIEFHEQMVDPTVSVSVENDEHRVVFAASSIWVNEHTGSYSAGDRATLTIRFRNVFAPGRYYLTPAISVRGGELELADRRPRVHTFLVTGTSATDGIVDLDHDLRLDLGAATVPEQAAVSS